MMICPVFNKEMNLCNNCTFYIDSDCTYKEDKETIKREDRSKTIQKQPKSIQKGLKTARK